MEIEDCFYTHSLESGTHWLKEGEGLKNSPHFSQEEDITYETKAQAL